MTLHCSPRILHPQVVDEFAPEEGAGEEGDEGEGEGEGEGGEGGGDEGAPAAAATLDGA